MYSSTNAGRISYIGFTTTLLELRQKSLTLRGVRECQILALIMQTDRFDCTAKANQVHHPFAFFAPSACGVLAFLSITEIKKAKLQLFSLS